MVAARPRTTNQQGNELSGVAIGGALQSGWKHHGTLMPNRVLGF